MSDAADYFRAYAVKALCKARATPLGRTRRIRRAIARIYHLLSKEAAFGPNLHHMADFRVAQRIEQKIDAPRSAIAQQHSTARSS